LAFLSVFGFRLLEFEDIWHTSSKVYLVWVVRTYVTTSTSLSLGLKEFFVFLCVSLCFFFWKKSFFFFLGVVCPDFLHPALDFLSFFLSLRKKGERRCFRFLSVNQRLSHVS